MKHLTELLLCNQCTRIPEMAVKQYWNSQQCRRSDLHPAVSDSPGDLSHQLKDRYIRYRALNSQPLFVISVNSSSGSSCMLLALSDTFSPPSST